MLEAAYSLLRVEKSASPEDVRKAYVRLARRYPPEHFPEKFAELSEAYRQLTLSDDFLSTAITRVRHNNSALSLAAFLWGDCKELLCEPDLAADELTPLLEGEETRRIIDSLLSTELDIEWKTGGNL